jgi:hypothetical protein
MIDDVLFSLGCGLVGSALIMGIVIAIVWL